MIQLDGIILVLSCQKYKNNRLKEFHLSKDRYEGWQVIYVLGDLFLDEKYKLEGNILTIKCEDSYIHLLKKLILALKFCYEIFELKEGVLRCGDDLIIDENELTKFIKSKKYDFYGQSDFKRNNYYPDKKQLKLLTVDNFMVRYYKNHQEDFNNPLHNLKNIDIGKYTTRPKVWGPHGIIYYISNKACRCLINTMEEINYNIFHFDLFTYSYPYTIEDCAVTYILYKNDFTFTDGQFFFDKPNSIAKHTNKYRDSEIIFDFNKVTVIGSEGKGIWGRRIIDKLISQINRGKEIQYHNSSDCNFIVKSHFTKDEPEWNNNPKPYLLWSGESYNVNIPKNAYKFLHLSTTFMPNSIYIPYVLDSPYLYKKRHLNKNRPFEIAYCSSNPIYLREKLYNKFVEKYGINENKCHALGKCYGGKYTNTHKIVNGTWESADLIEEYKNYKFAFAIENKKVKGYVTEKIMNAFHAGCIPIYWGSENINDLFNPEAFINLSNFDSIDDCVDFVSKLSEEEIINMQNKPIYNEKSELINLLNDDYNTTYENKTLITYLTKIIATIS